MNNLCDIIKILGVYFGGDAEKREERTKRVMCFQKFLEDYESPWKMFLGELLKPIGGKFLLHCNFEVSKLNISLPAFYRQCLVAWSELNAREPIV